MYLPERSAQLAGENVGIEVSAGKLCDGVDEFFVDTHDEGHRAARDAGDNVSCAHDQPFGADQEILNECFGISEVPHGGNFSM